MPLRKLFGSTTIELCHSHSRDTILYVDRNRLSKLYILYVFDRGNEIKGDSSVCNSYVLSMEITLVTTVFIGSLPPLVRSVSSLSPYG